LFSSRRRHTRFSRDWSSDVCSSDLPTPVALTRLRAPGSVMGPSSADAVKAVIAASALLPTYGTAVDPVSAYEKLEAKSAAPAPKIGRASCREREGSSSAAVATSEQR